MLSNPKVVLVLLALTAAGCGEALAPAYDAHGLGPVEVVPGTTASSAIDRGQPPDSGTPTAISPDAGASAENLARALWEATQASVFATNDLESGDDSYGHRAVTWVRTATRLANLGKVVTYGTVTEGGSGYFSWSPAPSGKLVIISQASPNFEITVTKITGNIADQYFPSASERFEFSWKGASAEFVASWSIGGSHWAGWYLDKAGHRLELDITTTFTSDTFASTTGVDNFATLTSAGTVKAQGFAVALTTEFDLESCIGDDCLKRSYSTRLVTAHLSRGGTTWKLSSVYVRTTSRFSGAVDRISLSGDILENGAQVGGLETRTVSRVGTVETIALVVKVRSDVYEPEYEYVFH